MTSAAIRNSKTPSPFSATLWKESRQFWPVAALGLLAVCGFLVAILDLVSYYRGQSSYVTFPLSHHYTLILTTVVFPLIAAALGFSQFFFETKPDLWAFLVHRPVHRAVIFRGKIAAGLLMYLVVTAVPFTLAVLWQSNPEHIPSPFDWSLALPGYVDIFSGAVYYFAAIVIARRQARWLGSRIFPIGLPIFNSVIIFAAATPWFALLTTTGLLAATFIAARGSFIAGGFYSPQNRPARFSLGVTIFSGLLFVVGIVLFIASLFFSTRYDFEYSNYTVHKDGNIVFGRYRFEENRYTEVNTDLEGCPVPGSVVSQGSTYSLQDIYSGIGASHYRFPERRYFQFGNFQNRNYYFDQDRQCILVYHSTARKFLGSIGPGGFAPGKYEPGSRFGKLVAPYFYNQLHQNDQSPHSTFVAGSSVYKLYNTGEPIVETLYTAPAGDKLLGTFVTNSNTDPRLSYVAVASSTRVVVLKHDNSVLVDIPIAQIPNATLLLWRASDSNRFIAWYDQRHLPSESARDYEFVTANAATGDITRVKLPNPGGRTIYKVSTPSHFLITAAPPIVFALVPGFEFLDAKLAGRTWSPPIQHMDAELAWVIGYLSVGVLLALIATVWISRRHAFSKSQTIAWCALAIPLGIPGVFLMVLLLDLPARIACPACKKRRIISRDLCEHCNAPFAAPAANGTEIFGTSHEPAEPLHA